MNDYIFNKIHEMINEYEKYVGEKPYVMLINPKTYIELRKYLENTNAWRYLSKIDDDKGKTRYIFGIRVEISHYLIQNAICMNERDYKKYCEYKYMKEKEIDNE